MSEPIFFFFPENLLVALGWRPAGRTSSGAAPDSNARPGSCGSDGGEGNAGPLPPRRPPRRFRRRAAETLLLLLCFAVGYGTAAALRAIGGPALDPAVRVSALLPPDGSPPASANRPR